MLNKNLAAVLSIFLGVFGAHQFYVGRWWTGVLQFAFFFFTIFTAIAGADEELIVMMFGVATLVPFITGIVWAAMPKEKWHLEYDPEAWAALHGTAPSAGPSVANAAELKSEGIRYYRSADYDLAAEAFVDAIKADGSDPSSHFNLACSYAQLGQYPAALQHLELSVTFGLSKPQRIEKHPALVTLRKLPMFQEFRDNNYRRDDHVGIADQRPREQTPAADAFTRTPPAEDSFTDFNQPPPVAPDEPEDMVNVDLLEQISRLRELHDAGILTSREYQTQKEKLLG